MDIWSLTVLFHADINEDIKYTLNVWHLLFDFKTKMNDAKQRSISL